MDKTLPIFETFDSTIESAESIVDYVNSNFKFYEIRVSHLFYYLFCIMTNNRFPGIVVHSRILPIDLKYRARRFAIRRITKQPMFTKKNLINTINSFGEVFKFPNNVVSISLCSRDCVTYNRQPNESCFYCKSKIENTYTFTK